MNTTPPTPPQGQLKFVTVALEAKALARKASAGLAQKITSGIYVLGATLPLKEVVRLHQNEIVSHIWPKGVYAGISAFSAGVPKEGLVFVAHPNPIRKTKLSLPGVTIYPVPGPTNLLNDILLPGGAYTSGAARKLVENINLVGKPPRHRSGTKAVEDAIDRLAQQGGGAIIKTLRELDLIASDFDSQAVEYVRVRLAALLGSNNVGVQTVSPRLGARLRGSAVDSYRIELFEKLTQTLETHAPSPRSAPEGKSEWAPFFESYFSNFIEGTEFGVDEAREIVIDGKEDRERPADAHDVSATFRLAHDPSDRIWVPKTGEELIKILKERHEILMAARGDKNPGVIKSKANWAGGTRFVDPVLVEGTLDRGFEAINKLTDPFSRAVAMMALITECHPFDDGNGRVARLTANAELSVAGQVRFIIPTSYRNDYVAALSGFSNGAGAGQSLLAVLDFAQKWTRSVDWTTFEAARKTLENCNAFVDPGVAERNGQRLKIPAY